MSTEEIKEYVLMLLQEKYDIEDDVDLQSFNYMESGYIDSMGLIAFIVDLEEHFNIEFSDEELECEQFKIVEGLIGIIENRINAGGA